MHDSMLKKLNQLQNIVNEIEVLLVDPETVKDIEKYKEIIVEFENIEMEPPLNMVDKLIILIDLYTLN